MRILALDLATKTGWACGTKTNGVGIIGNVGTWDLKEKQDGKVIDRVNRTCDPRFKRLFNNLRALHLLNDFDWVVFEDVQFANTTAQAQLWPTWRAAIWAIAAMHPGLRVDCLDTSGLKKFATGHGGADKTAMAVALARADKRFTLDRDHVRDTFQQDLLLTDDAVDAIWLLKWAFHTFR